MMNLLFYIALTFKNVSSQEMMDVRVELSNARQSSTMVSDFYPDVGIASNPITNEVDESNPDDWLSVQPFSCMRT
jgi:hypothetical protein